MPASFSPGQDALSKNPATRPRTWRAQPGRRAIRGALLFGYFLLGKQEKVTRAAAAARKPAAGEPGRDIATTEDRRYWIPAYAGMTRQGRKPAAGKLMKAKQPAQ